MANKTEPHTIQKSESKVSTKLPARSEKGNPGIISASRFIQDIRKEELQMPRRVQCTYPSMLMDDAVFNSVDITNKMVTTALDNGAVESTGTTKSDVAAKFLNYCIRNMTIGTWLQAMENASTDVIYGWSDLNIVLERRDYGPYAGSMCLRKLAPRDQKRVYAWVFDDSGREFRGFLMRPSTVKLTPQNKFIGMITETQAVSDNPANYPFLRTQDVLHFTYGSTNNNPQGDSPLAHCFDAWMEKKLVESYELSGTAKDLGGIVVLRSPSELFERAAEPAEYPQEAAAKRELETDAANLHTGKTTYVHLQSDRDERGNYLYDFELKGITGAGRQFDTTDIINEKKKSIYNVFGTQALLLGQDNVGSNALSRDQNTTFSYYVQRNIKQKVDVINTQLLPRILAANNIYLDYDDMPVFSAINPFKLSYDEAGKFIQRVKSVGGMTKEVLEFVYKDLGVPTEGIDELDFSSKGDSRAGESKGSSGTGDSQEGGSASEMNMDNGASADKSLITAATDCDRIFDDNGNCINEDELDELGNYK